MAGEEAVTEVEAEAATEDGAVIEAEDEAALVVAVVVMAQPE